MRNRDQSKLTLVSLVRDQLSDCCLEYANVPAYSVSKPHAKRHDDLTR
jgi:hypothetical protein